MVVFYAAYPYPDNVDPGPLCYITSSYGGATWSSPTSLGHDVYYEAVFTVAYDSTNNKVWVGLSDAAKKAVAIITWGLLFVERVATGRLYQCNLYINSQLVQPRFSP